MQRSLLTVWVSLALACGGGGGADIPERDVVATIDGEPILRADLDLYFRVNLLGPPEALSMEEDPDAENLARVKSRLFDAFMEEQTLLAEARRREIRVTDEEIAAYVDLGRVEGQGVAELSLSSRRRLARARLLVQKLQEQITDEIAPPSDEEVAEFAARAADLPAGGKHVLVRVLPFDSAETARDVHSDIRRNRTTFAEVALEHETQPGQASPQEIAWDLLPAAVRATLEDLKPGEVSAPVDHNGLIYLFQVQAWLEDAGWVERERLRVARERLVQLKSSEATFELVSELKAAREIKLWTEHLGFRYVPGPAD